MDKKAARDAVEKRFEQICPYCRSSGTLLNHGVHLNSKICSKCGLEIEDVHLKTFNKGYTTALGEMAQKIQLLMAERDKFFSEAKAAAGLLWATIMEHGGEIRIPDSVMQRSHSMTAGLETGYDPEQRLTVIKAIEEKHTVN